MAAWWATLFVPPVAFGFSTAVDAPAQDAIVYHTPILGLWREPGSPFVIQTGYGEFRYLGAATCHDGQALLTQSDPSQALLKELCFRADGMAVDLSVSARCPGVLVGLGAVAAPLVPAKPAPSAPGGGGS